MSSPTFHGPPSRRTVLKTAAFGGVALGAWSVPVVEMFSMSASTAEAVSGPPTSPSFSIEPTEITAPPDPTGGSTATVTSTVTATGDGGSGGGGLGGGSVSGQAAGRGELAATGVNLPVGATTAVAVGAIAAGVAAVALGNRTSAATAEGSADVVDVPRGPRRH